MTEEKLKQREREKLREVLAIVKLEPLLKKYAPYININGGIKMRVNGKNTNASSKSGETELKPDEKEAIMISCVMLGKDLIKYGTKK